MPHIMLQCLKTVMFMTLENSIPLLYFEAHQLLKLCVPWVYLLFCISIQIRTPDEKTIICLCIIWDRHKLHGGHLGLQVPGGWEVCWRCHVHLVIACWNNLSWQNLRFRYENLTSWHNVTLYLAVLHRFPYFGFNFQNLRRFLKFSLSIVTLFAYFLNSTYTWSEKR